MLRSFINSVRPSATATVKSTASRTIKPITIYHNPNSLYSHNLLNKLTNFNSILDINVHNNEHLSQNDYNFIIDECLSIHPDNKSIMLQIFHPHKKQLCKTKLLKDFSLHDLIYDYKNLAHDGGHHLPLIIDFNNKLIANDDATIDRILVNYLTCGIQNTTNTRPPSKLDGKKKSPSMVTSGQYNDLVHPHAAEFADLF
ncbi:hypothetical protein Cantr_01050 [Candida viswanathii]|uniref:Uncharacterized protein n=1 Tax=Candida viswanathii TaxID=5486 RepID=A0A367YI24_9ASCO|nr:hypothetical protein Cantr_01050 [Candida viswanathii]